MNRTLGLLFGLGALAAGGIGFISLSEATFGVGVIALGLLAAVFTRIFQASAHHGDMAARQIAIQSLLEKQQRDTADLLAAARTQARVGTIRDSLEPPTLP